MTQSASNRPDASICATPRVAAVTMSRDEGAMLQRWVTYYGEQLGTDNLVIIDDNSVDGSTQDLPCPVIRLPPAPLKHPWISTRRRMINDLAKMLLVCNDVVIATDVDEFLVPDPAVHPSLLDYFGTRGKTDVLAPLAVNVLHNQQVEPALDPRLGVLAQRRFVKFAPGLCKPLIKRVPASWMAGIHGIKAPFEVDRELLLFHLKYFDVDTMRTVWEHRQRVHLEEERGSPHSEWPVGSDDLLGLLSGWARTSDPDSLPEFDPQEVDLRGLIRKKREGFFRVHGTSLKAMEIYPLRRLPSRFTELL